MSCTLIAPAFVSALAAVEHGLPFDKNDFFEGFETGKLNNWVQADYDFSHPHFDTDWRTENIQLNQGKLEFSVMPHRGQNNFSGSSVRRPVRSHYGRYSAFIRPAVGSGFVTGFFVYTGEYYGTRHDEIDIEFLGKDTKRIHLSTFTDGVLKTTSVELGFDAAMSWHQYGFDWYPEKIVWWVDGCEIHRIELITSAIPQVPSFLFANLWAADRKIEEWAGLADLRKSGKSEIAQISFTPFVGLEQGN